MTAPEVSQLTQFFQTRGLNKKMLSLDFLSSPDLLDFRVPAAIWERPSSAQIATSNWFPPLVYLIFNGIFAIVFVFFQILHFADNIPALCLIYTIGGTDILLEFSRDEVRIPSS